MFSRFLIITLCYRFVQRFRIIFQMFSSYFNWFKLLKDLSEIVKEKTSD